MSGDAAAEAQVDDVAALLADHRADRAEAARLVDGHDLQPGDALASARRLPAEIEPALRVAAAPGQGRGTRRDGSLTPRPVRTRPTMASPGTGRQQPAKWKAMPGQQAAHQAAVLVRRRRRPRPAQRHDVVVGGSPRAAPACSSRRRASSTSAAVERALADRRQQVVDRSSGAGPRAPLSSCLSLDRDLLLRRRAAAARGRGR